ncbi:MAG TPA: bifunctional serine/threonine-protein kinase/formylglycine-generating enzyme family protein [Blastocatellia bacterium]|nr:bifunctional serine/threonine-protein kinase/formylglycine-generating enzyme family protein [Blastocatellia bacterium]
MKECAACGREFQDDVQFCPIDGQPLDHKKTSELDAASLNDPLIGTVLDDKYRLDRKIGEGGMGAVYHATHIHMDSSFAVKLLHRSMVADQGAVERFRREARAAARIRHTNAVSVTDFGVTKEGTVYLVMEYLEGGDLRERLKKVGILSPADSVRIIAQTCAAIEEAHRKGIVHRDLKPDNIWLLTRDDIDDQVKVLDFGIAKLKTQGPQSSNLTQQGMVVGTPHYMSPEQCRGEELDSRSDIYALGVILYEMLTGDVPFRAPTPVGVVLKHANELPKPLREQNPSIPEPVERVVMKALEKDAAKRQPSAAELGRELIDAIRMSGTASIEIPGFETGDFLPVSSTGSTTAPGKQTGSTTAPQSEHDTSVQDPNKTGRVGGGATVAMTQKQANAKTQPPVVGGTQVMASQTASSDTVSDRPAPVERVIERVIEREAPAPNRTMLYAAVAAVVVIGIIVTIVLVMRNPGSGQANVNKPPVTNTGGTTATGTAPEGMILIKGATFKMGTDDPTAEDSDKPAHDVTLKDYYIDTYEVTNEEYQQFVKQTGYKPPKDWTGTDFPSGEAKFPVRNVTWYDADEYAKWAGKRLPTEAEWEYAARGPEGRIYPWGNDWSPKLSNSKEDGRDGPLTVGSYPGGVSSFGVFDMAGNVCEWVADDFVPYPGSKQAPDPGNKCYRGGAYAAPKERLKTTFRWWDHPVTPHAFIGFRCAKDATPAP